MSYDNVHTFSHLLLNNNPGLVHFLSGHDALENIKALSESPSFLRKPTKNVLYFNQWQVCWIIIKSPLDIIFSQVCHYIALACDFLNYKNGGRIFTVLSSQFLRDWHQLKEQWKYDEKLLVPTYNQHQTMTCDIYNYGLIPLDGEIQMNKEIEEMTWSHHSKELAIQEGFDKFYRILNLEFVSAEEKDQTVEEFKRLFDTDEKGAIEMLRAKYPGDKIERAVTALYHLIKYKEHKAPQGINLYYGDKGLCAGGNLWFIYLCLKASAYFKDQKKLLIAVAQQFTTGVPRQGAFLQAFPHSDALLKFLGLDQSHLPEHTASLLELDHDPEKVLEKIEQLPPGHIYRMGVYQHSIVFAKLADGSCYMINLPTGLMPTTPKEILELILNSYHQKGNPYSSIWIQNYSLTPIQSELLTP